MKKLYSLCMLTLCCVIPILFYACSSDPLSDLNDVNKENTKNDLQLLESLGYDLSGIHEMDEYYMIQPDIIVSKSRLEEIRNTPETRMQKDNIYGLLNEKNTYVLISDKNLEGDYRLEAVKGFLHYAIDAWNNISNCGLKFYIDNTSSNAVDISAGYDGEGIAALYFERPSAKGEYGKIVRINLSVLHNQIITGDQGNFLLMHTLGHIAGFAHAITDHMVMNPQPGHITGSSTNDDRSIMRSESDIIKGEYTWTGFSSGDLWAIREVYKPKNATKDIICKLSGTVITGNKLALYKTYEISANYIHPTCANPQYKISVSSSGFEITEIKNGTSSVRFTAGGNYEVTVEVLNSPDQVKFTREFILPYPVPAVKNITCNPLPEDTGVDELLLNKTYQISASYVQPDCPKPQYNIYIEDAAGYRLNKINANTVSVRFSDRGTYKVVVEITNAPVPTKFSKTYVVKNESWVRIHGPESVKLGEENVFNISYIDFEYPNPEYVISIKETTFNDPQYRITNNAKDNITVCFDQPGSYIIEARIKDHPEITMGKYYVNVFWSFDYTLGETVLTGINGDLNVYKANLFPESNIIEYRTVLYTHVRVKDNEIYKLGSDGTKQKIKFNIKGHVNRIEPIILQEDIVEFIELPALEEIKSNDPFIGTIYLIPYYEKITFPENYAKEYNPNIKE